jgi:hypothetical protein
MPSTAQRQSLEKIEYVSSADNSKQPAMFYFPDTKETVPFLVALHTWAGDYTQNYHAGCAQWCIENGWAYIHPHFRGPNRRPEAAGSEFVVKDIVSAVDYAKKTARIDASNIYLVGTSGGGYTALLMAGRHPEIWTGVSVWVPISDLKAWYFECRNAGRDYYKDIIKSCGGSPGDSTTIDEEYRKRSPLTYLGNAKGLSMHINAGITDGHNGSVPISHSLRAFNAVADVKDRLSEEDICFFSEKAVVPATLEKPLSDPSYGMKQPLFRRSSGNATVTIFRGGHELVHEAAMSWFKKIHKYPSILC